MNSLPARLVAAGIVLCTGEAQAVVITTNSQVYSTTVTVGSITTTDNTPPTTQTFPQNGTISSSGTTPTPTSLGAGSWEFYQTNLAGVSASRGNTPGNEQVTVDASSIYTISFTLGAGESALVTLDMDYSLVKSQGGGHNTSLGWSFTGPGGSIPAIFGNISTSATNTSITQQQVNITAGGTYTFTLTGAIPSGAMNKNSSTSVSVNSFDFKIVAVPETSSALLGALGMSLLVMRRRRIPS